MKSFIKGLVLISFLLLITLPAQGQLPTLEDDDLFARVIDSGQALCVVIKMPDNHYMIYDAGNWRSEGEEAYISIKEIIPEGSTIDLMVLSHSDGDHLGAVDEICDTYTVKRIIRSGFERSTGTWTNADNAIDLEKKNEKCKVVDLSYFDFPPGATYRYGEVFVTMVYGLHKPPDEWGLSKGSGEYRNAGSIVIRVEYKGKSILLCGDTVGRHKGDPEDECRFAEKEMVEMSNVIKIDSDIIIAPHHGADNGNSKSFIEKVSPEYVIFSAGHETRYQHPREIVAQRYLDCHVDINKMFRTDLGDDDGIKEWKHGRINGHKDPSGDDDVDIIIRANGNIEVKYKDS